MRTILLAMLVAAGIGLLGASGASAVPVNGAALGDAATTIDHVTQVQHWRWGSGGHWRWGSRGGHWRWGSGPIIVPRGCHTRPWSRWRPRCWM